MIEEGIKDGIWTGDWVLGQRPDGYESTTEIINELKEKFGEEKTLQLINKEMIGEKLGHEFSDEYDTILKDAKDNNLPTQMIPILLEYNKRYCDFLREQLKQS